MPELNNYKISFLYCGRAEAIYITADSCHEAHKWRYVASYLGLCCDDTNGYPLLSHSIKNLVEENAVSDVLVEIVENTFAKNC